MNLKWNVQGADDVRQWKSATFPDAVQPLNWSKIAELSEKVEPSGQEELIIEGPTACYVVARGQRGLSGRSIMINAVDDGSKKTAEPGAWSPPRVLRTQFIDAPHVLRPAPAPGPIVNMTVNKNAVFVNETSTISWSIIGAGCATMNRTRHYVELTEDPNEVSGRRWVRGGYGNEDAVACSCPMSGNIQEQLPHGQNGFVIYADGQAATTGVDVLPIPQFVTLKTDSDPNFWTTTNAPPAPDRIQGIKDALLWIAARLRGGWIRDATSLDAEVPEFQLGHLSRISDIYWPLLAELQNLNLITFGIEEVLTATFKVGSWTDYTNRIALQWKGIYGPNYTYVILHELVHKCGFNAGLKKFHPEFQKPDGTYDEIAFHDLIEPQTAKVAGACFWNTPTG